MRITNVKVIATRPGQGPGPDRLKGFAKIVIDDCLVVHDIRIIKGHGGYLVAMPDKKLKDGSFQDVIHPINKGAREMIERAVMDEYRKVIGGRAA